MYGEQSFTAYTSSTKYSLMGSLAFDTSKLCSPTEFLTDSYSSLTRGWRSNIVTVSELPRALSFVKKNEEFALRFGVNYNAVGVLFWGVKLINDEFKFKFDCCSSSRAPSSLAGLLDDSSPSPNSSSMRLGRAGDSFFGCEAFWNCFRSFLSCFDILLADMSSD